MRRRAHTPRDTAAGTATARAATRRTGWAAALAAGAVLLTGCTGGSGPDGAAQDSKAGDGAGQAAAPGRYRTLLEPCGSVSAATLRELLPSAADLTDEQRERVYQGTPAVTYDTDRRAGCSWKADGPDASHQLVLDFERVVSYDPEVSDDERAQQVYGDKESAVLPAAPPTASAKPSTPDGAPSESPADPSPTSETSPGGAPRPSASGKPGGSGPLDPSGSAATGEGLEPRVLTGLGDAAFLDDVLDRAGSTAQYRTVSVVFRTSNVVVTIRYAEQPASITEVPDSAELQDKAQGLARGLAERFDE
ncbi:DUF3558 domain-containing protein [Streptomyces lichenis]|uniref:DUF3558 domain-containing protein n=1 Tax=Streptomyces lichenis TaxID=2306967 RepID=UPI0027E3630E|nr:DUF3558 domain-containing protein [Streptomyces lichenis]